MAAEQATTLLSLPTLLWSGVIAAVVSLTGAVLGVILSNRSSEQRLLAQLRHDAAEKHRDRLAALRRDVYLKLFEELSAVSGHLGALAGKDPVSENLGEPLQAAMAQLGKVQLVGSQQTALLAGQLSNLYGESLFRLMLAAKPMHQLKTNIGLADKAFEGHVAEAQRANREIRAMNESGKPDPSRFKALRASAEFAREQFEAAGEARTSAWESFNALQKPFMQAVFSELNLLGPAQAKLMAAMREEIGLTADLNFMLERFEQTQKRMHGAADGLLDQLMSD